MGRGAEPMPQAGRDRQAVRYQPQRRRVHAESEVRAAHLDVLVQVGLPFDARLPRHDPVTPRVDRRRGHADRLADLLARGHPVGGMLPAAPLVGAVGMALPGVGQRERAAEGDDTPHLARALAR